MFNVHIVYFFVFSTDRVSFALQSYNKFSISNGIIINKKRTKVILGHFIDNDYAPPYLHDALFFTLLYIQTNQNLHIRHHPGQTSQASRL
jgi:hypothetical protein